VERGPVVPSSGVLRPVSPEAARITGGFWATRQAANTGGTLPHAHAWMDRLGWTGHPEIETALVEWYRVTGERRYLEQARLFVARRGHRSLPEHEFGWGYFNDDVPMGAADVLHGHAVRALYLASGAVDVAVETGDGDLLDAVVRQFDRTLARRTYLTGGMGSRHQDESFGADFVLRARRGPATMRVWLPATPS